MADRQCRLVFGVKVPILNLGGGFDRAFHLGRDSCLTKRQLRSTLGKSGLKPEGLRIIAEPGRTLLQKCGWLLATIHTTKIRNDRYLAVVDASIDFLPAFSRLPQSITILGQDGFVSDGQETGGWSAEIVGCTCLEEDVLGEVRTRRPIKEGDIVVFHNVGAYDFSASRSWTRHRPPVLVCDGAGARIWFRSERLTGQPWSMCETE